MGLDRCDTRRMPQLARAVLLATVASAAPPAPGPRTANLLTCADGPGGAAVTARGSVPASRPVA